MSCAVDDQHKIGVANAEAVDETGGASVATEIGADRGMRKVICIGFFFFFVIAGLV